MVPEPNLSMLDLPATVLNAIAREALRKGANGHPMLAVAKACRDVVLESLSKITLDLSSQSEGASHQPLARLLNRACCGAAPGLHVKLGLGEHGDVALPLLLQPGLDCAGWHNVHKLEVRYKASCRC
jgi:hypothetical protein